MYTLFNIEEIKEDRKQAGKTQEQLAEEADMSVRQVSRIENGVNLEQFKKYLLLLSALGYKIIKMPE